MVDLDKLEERYSGEKPPVAMCPSCGAPLELAFREDNGDEEWHCSNVPAHRHFCRNSGIDKDVLSAVAELRERRKDEIRYQEFIQLSHTLATKLLEHNEIDESAEILARLDRITSEWKV